MPLASVHGKWPQDVQHHGAEPVHQQQKGTRSKPLQRRLQARGQVRNQSFELRRDANVEPDDAPALARNF